MNLGWRLAHLRVLLMVNGGVLAAAAVVGWLVGGGVAGAGAGVGVGLVVASYLVSTLVIAWADSVNPSLVLPFGLMTYIVKFTLIGMVMAAVVATGWAGLPAMGMGVVAGVVGWTGTHIWWLLRHQPRLHYTAPGGGD